MNMTNYMELLANNQPWNLILFMGIPVALAETLVVTEFYVLYTRNLTGIVRLINRWVGILLGFYFLLAFLYLLVARGRPPHPQRRLARLDRRRRGRVLPGHGHCDGAGPAA